MYDLVDQPVRNLPPFELRTLMRLRNWVLAFSRGAGETDRAVPRDPFSEAMRLLDEWSGEDMLIGRPCEGTVGESEAILVAFWRLIRFGSHGSARDLAAGLIGTSRSDRLVLAVSASMSD